jgi:Uma2 family endonuclease
VNPAPGPAFWQPNLRIVMASVTAARPLISADTFPINVRGEWASRMTEDEFWQFCQDNPHLRIERDEDYTISIMPPTGYVPGARSGEAFLQLGIWHRQHGAGVVCDSSTGFTLPDRSVRSPDASWVSPERDATVVGRDRERFARICPDFIVEVASPSDSVAALHEKMRVWLANGVRLGFLLDPATETAWVYRPGAEPREVSGFDQTLSGEEVLPGFALELRRLRR